MLVALTTAKGLFWIGLTPALLVADEPAHFDCVQFRGEHYGPPRYDGSGHPINKVISPGASPEMRELWQHTIPAKYYKKAHANDHLPEKLEQLALTQVGRDTNGQNPAIDYPGLYYILGVPLYKAFLTSSIVTRIFAVRILSMLFLLLATLATYFAARLVQEEGGLAFAAAALVALQPMASQQGASVNNDAGIIGVAALAFYFQLRTLSTLPKVPSPGTLAGLMLSSIGIVLTKPNGYGLLPGTAVVLAIVGWTHRRQRYVQVASGAAVLIGLIGLLLAPRLAVNLNALVPGDTDAPGIYGSPSFIAFLDSLDQNYFDYLLRSSWGQFGWLDFSMQHEWVTRLRWIEALFELGMIAAIVQYVLRDAEEQSWYRFWLWMFSFCSLLGGVLFILFVEHRFRLTGLLGVIQGRNFLYVLPAFAVWGIVCLGATLPRSMRGLAAALLFSGIVCFHLVGVITILHQHYVN